MSGYPLSQSASSTNLVLVIFIIWTFCMLRSIQCKALCSRWLMVGTDRVWSSAPEGITVNSRPWCSASSVAQLLGSSFWYRFLRATLWLSPTYGVPRGVGWALCPPVSQAKLAPHSSTDTCVFCGRSRIVLTSAIKRTLWNTTQM